ncbi:hypothetical protein [Mycobacteroides abscessus]|uniref:hypothetical protein n=1 Tax=Mycobacteroides abscessus TaxID=36809 RepID=UPI0019D29085|nr:hypothetical protein [Mycobacteroides abscessus]
MSLITRDALNRVIDVLLRLTTGALNGGAHLPVGLALRGIDLRLNLDAGTPRGHGASPLHSEGLAGLQAHPHEKSRTDEHPEAHERVVTE